MLRGNRHRQRPSDKNANLISCNTFTVADFIKAFPAVFSLSLPTSRRISLLTVLVVTVVDHILANSNLDFVVFSAPVLYWFSAAAATLEAKSCINLLTLKLAKENEWLPTLGGGGVDDPPT